MSDFTLVIANKNYSSWSLRPWLAMRMAGIAFDEIIIPLRQPESRAAILAHSAAGQVPVLKHGERTIWESIAILEYLAELFPAAKLWPEDEAARAHARCVAAEMHAGFRPLRMNMPMNVRASKPGHGMNPEVAADIARIGQIWRECRARYGAAGPFLFGAFSNADAMYAPVVTRFTTYGVALDDIGQAYCRTILDLPPMVEWYAAGKAETWSIPDND
jgi:glutathione S-transferase